MNRKQLHITQNLPLLDSKIGEFLEIGVAVSD